MTQITKFTPDYAALGMFLRGDKYFLVPYGNCSVAWVNKEGKMSGIYSRAEDCMDYYGDTVYYKFRTFMEGVAWFIS